MRQIIILLLFGFSVSLNAQVQSVLSANGTTYKSSQLAIDFTLGEIAITSIKNSNVQITQGFHQPQLKVTAVDDIALSPNISVFPNPTSEYIIARLDESFASKQLVINLYDGNGKLCYEEKSSPINNEININMNSFLPGIYILKLSASKTTPNYTFKIIKSN